jgi:hypothetical protein
VLNSERRADAPAEVAAVVLSPEGPATVGSAEASSTGAAGTTACEGSTAAAVGGREDGGSAAEVVVLRAGSAASATPIGPSRGGAVPRFSAAAVGGRPNRVDGVVAFCALCGAPVLAWAPVTADDVAGIDYRSGWDSLIG